MSDRQSWRDCEYEWQTLISRFKAGSPVLAVCGPSGVGKSSTVAGLAATYATFIEADAENPYLDRFLKGGDGFSAADNQRWFLQRVSRFVAGADERFPIVLDQDPAAIVLVYSRVFYEQGDINEAEYLSLWRDLVAIERGLQRWKSPRIALVLDAPVGLLYRRVLDRYGASRIPTAEWFEKIRNGFLDFSTRLPIAVQVSTAGESLEQVISEADLLVRNAM